MIWLVITFISVSFIVGMMLGRLLGIRETEHQLHIITGKKATKRFREKTDLGKYLD